MDVGCKVPGPIDAADTFLRVLCRSHVTGRTDCALDTEFSSGKIQLLYAMKESEREKERERMKERVCARSAVELARDQSSIRIVSSVCAM